jgi:hypothetical protein
MCIRFPSAFRTPESHAVIMLLSRPVECSFLCQQCEFRFSNRSIRRLKSHSEANGQSVCLASVIALPISSGNRFKYRSPMQTAKGSDYCTVGFAQLFRSAESFRMLYVDRPNLHVTALGIVDDRRWRVGRAARTYMLQGSETSHRRLNKQWGQSCGHGTPGT